MKSKARRFHPDFVADLSSATDYYDTVSVAVGAKLRQEVQATLELIASTPEGFAAVYKDVRALRIKKFPLIMLYRSYPDYVQFLGLVQGGTERKHWFDED